MSTMRSGREIRTIVEQARHFGNSSKTNTYDMSVDENDELLMHAQQNGMNDRKYSTMNGEVPELQKKLLAMKAELDDMKQKYGALKRNYDSISHHSAKDSVENVRLQKMRDDYESQIKALQFALAKVQDEVVA